ncbi:peptidoglycan-binding protein, partial [Streptomyces sp. SID7760]|nr:peptidoglycan-binding protein [Streptomyces sp. SID7760]
SLDSYDPVANITAACNYAAARYGSIDNVNGAY